MLPPDEAKKEKHDAPDESHAARDFQEFCGIDGAIAKRIQIHNAGGGHGIEGTAGVGHGYGKNGGEENAGKASGHFANEEKRQDAIGAIAGGEQGSVLRKDEEKDSYGQEHEELEQDDETAGEDGAAAVALRARGEEALDNGLVGAVSGHGEKGAADDAGPNGVIGG